MSDTPRTDARRGFHGWYTAVDAEFSEKLERELNAANAEVDRMTAKVAQLYEGAEEQTQRIKRLEEALEGTIKCFVDLVDSGDAGFWNPEEQSVIIAARAALQAKEAKP